MAITIKQLNVTLHIGKDTSNVVETKSSNTTEDRSTDAHNNADNLVEETAREVLRILNEQKER